MTKNKREFDVVPVAVVLAKARLLEEDDFASAGFEETCAPVADGSPETFPSGGADMASEADKGGK